MAFAQRQHLGALQEAPHALGVFLLVHLSTLSFAPPSCGGRKSGPSREASCADMGRDPNLARPDRRCGYSREACRAMTIVHRIQIKQTGRISCLTVTVPSKVQTRKLPSWLP